MFGPARSFVLTLLLAAFVAAAPAEVVERAAPKNWNYDLFEPYDTYHTRYMDLECQKEHGTKFFTVCCGPLLKSQSLSDRPEVCDPAYDCTDDE
ncbi:hypothetical protein AURDEDRAFT_110768 [Auricularia subglabra TFB-10046 SS5]|nr:hypothetical protein AURDEDRAFT_110768 [Auricularia subglabra TFB-10046 SS5]